jgi:LacI family transcriptional regulator
MKKKISIGDIAKELGISKTTVSFVLNGKGAENHISETLQKRILDYIAEVGYQPNQFARGLRTGKTHMIAVLVEDISDPFFASITRTIEDRAYKKGYKIVCSSTENDPTKAKELIAAFRSRQVDGFIIAPPPGIEDEISALIADNLPVVLFDRYFPSVITDHIVVDNFQGAYDAMNYFYECGHKNIGFVTLSSDQMQMQDRLNGYMRSADENKGEYFIKRISFDQELDFIVEDIKKFLKSNKTLDGIFFATNYLADAGLEAIQSLGWKIPDQLGVVVFDDYHSFRLIDPPITAVDQPVQDISENVISVMLSKLTDPAKEKERKNIVLPTKLVIRRSTKNYDKVRV